MKISSKKWVRTVFLLEGGGRGEQGERCEKYFVGLEGLRRRFVREGLRV
jgi:hypothetical protein